MKYIITVLAIFGCFLGGAEVKKWSLEDCINYAIENSSNKKKQDQQNNIHKYNYTDALIGLLPSVGASTNVNLNYGRGLDGETNTYTDINSFNNGYGISSSMMLFNGFSAINKIKLQKVNKLMGKQELQNLVDMLAYETMEKYYSVLYCIEMQQLMENKLEESRKELRKVKKEQEVGLKGFPDVAEIEAKEAQDSYNLTKRRNVLTIAIIQLKEKMNYPLDEELELKEYEPLNLVVKTEDKAFDVFEQSKKYNPKALVSESKLKSQNLSYKRSKSALYPRLSLSGGYSTNFFRYMNTTPYSPFTNQVKDKLSKYMGFSLSIPIFNNLSARTQVKISRADLEIRKIEHDKNLRDLYTEIEQAVADMNGQADEYFYAEKQLKAMDVAHSVNKRKFEEGLINAIDLHTSSNRLLQAQTDMLNANITYRLKHKLVNYYKGEPFVK